MSNYDTLLYMLEQTKDNLPAIGILLSVMWGCYGITVLTGYRPLYLGIHPRKAIGLLGIIFAPFLHAGFNHIFFNSIPLVILSNFILLSGVDYYLNVSLYISLASGILVWLVGRPLIHVGASSLITGYWSYLVIDAFHVGGLQAIILAIVSVYYFAGIFMGIFPSDDGVSWEGHLSGFVAGIALNYSINYLPAIDFTYLFGSLFQTVPPQ